MSRTRFGRSIAALAAVLALVGVAVPAAAAARAPVGCTDGSAACPIRIVFAPGAWSGQASGHLSGIPGEQWFVVRARAGQTMVVVVEGAGPTRGIVIAPDGRQEGQPGGRVFDQPLSISGDDRIVVTESPMAEAWSGRVDVVALIY